MCVHTDHVHERSCLHDPKNPRVETTQMNTHQGMDKQDVYPGDGIFSSYRKERRADARYGMG